MSTKLIIGIAENATVEISADANKDLVRGAAFWHGLPSTCPLCSAPVFFTFREPSGNDYYGMRCTGSPAHETDFGIHKDGDKDLYYKESEPWKLAYRERNAGGSGNGQQLATAQDFPNEHKRLDGLIETEWAKQPRSYTFADAVDKKFQKRPEQLSIDEKRQILESLKGAAAA